MRVRLAGSRVTPGPVLLGHPLHAVVVADDPAVLWDIVGDLRDHELGEIAARCLKADFLDDVQQDGVVARDVLVHAEMRGSRGVPGELEVHVLGCL